MSRLLTTVLVLLSFVLLSFDAWAKTELSAKDKLKIAQAFGKIPLYFVKNDGQVDSKVKFYEKGIGRSTFFAEDGVYISLIASVQEHAKTAPEASAASHVLTEFIAIKPLNIEGAVEVTAQDPLPSKLHYYRGSDHTKWQSNVLAYSKVSYKGIYDGIELVFYGNQRQLEYDIVVSAGANPSKVNFLIEGAKAVSVNTDGDLEIILSSGSKILQKKPYSYQKIDGSQVEIPSSFKVQAHDSGYILAFEVGQYDKSLPLIIDPVVLSYSTFLGGSSDDIGRSIAVDSSGNIYVAGETMSNNFPTLNAYQTSYAGAGDAFITKLSFSSDATKEKFGVISAVVPYNSQTTYVLSTKAIAGSDYRIDPDGTKSYKVQIVLSRLDSGVITKQVVIDELYAGWTDNNEASRTLARGALLVRSSGVKVFFSEKATDVYYGQDGYIYSNDLNLSLTFTKTPLFSSANWGWYPYFDNNGDLWHFSYAGYYMYKNTTAVAYSSPSDSAKYMQEQKLLQIGKAVSLTAEMNWNDLENELLGYLSTMLKFTLTVNKTGSGSGTVLGALAGINCGSTCSANLINGSAVTLTATSDNGSSFVGFAGGGCSGAGPCTVVLNSDVTVTATFESLPQISGIVRDSQGVGIPNATVTITKDTFTTTLQTNASGAFSSFLNDIGTYLVSVSKTGYFNSASSVVLTATAKSANIEFTLAISGDFIPLRQGWNFVSFPKLPTDKSISNVLAGKDILIVWGFDNQNKQWLKFKPNDASSSLSSFDYAKGYWIYANQIDNISLEGWLPPSSTTSTLYPGWNLVGYNFTNALDANTALSSIATKAEILWNWDNASWQFKLINPAITLPSAFAPMSTVDKLYQGKAYWIRMRQEGVWSE